eukprot:5631529-Pyramimonas_sp.AAC.1
MPKISIVGSSGELVERAKKTLGNLAGKTARYTGARKVRRRRWLALTARAKRLKGLRGKKSKALRSRFYLAGVRSTIHYGAGTS